MRRANREINFRMKASPGRGKLSPQVTDEGADKQQLTENYPSSGAARHPLPLLSLCDIFPRPGEICPQGVKAFALLIFVPGKNFAGIICRR